MDWKSEITEFYRFKEKFFCWRTKDDALSDFSVYVIPALKDIEITLKPFVKRIDIVKNYGDRVFSANLSFEEKNIGKSAFVVEAELDNHFIRISTYDGLSDRRYFLRLDSDYFLTKDVIINEFMVFYRGRSNVTKLN